MNSRYETLLSLEKLVVWGHSLGSNIATFEGEMRK
jgi:hypothetical protein